jgi:hypothetical protein
VVLREEELEREVVEPKNAVLASNQLEESVAVDLAD